MSNQTAEATVVAKFEELAEAFDLSLREAHQLVGEHLEEESSEAKADSIIASAKADDEQTPTESEDTSEAGDDDEPTIEDGEVACQCGAVFDSKQSLYGHSSHCDEYESSTEGGDEEEEQSPTETEDEEVPEHPEDADNPTQENYVFHFGTCSEEGCSYGANGEEAEFCASHQGSSSSSKKNKSSSSKTTSYEDLSEGEKSLVQDLISDEGKSLEEAVEMV
jgi:hypothetical protein